MLNRCVFSLDLKVACDGLECTSLGREFHTVGETKRKDRHTHACQRTTTLITKRKTTVRQANLRHCHRNHHKFSAQPLKAELSTSSLGHSACPALKSSTQPACNIVIPLSHDQKGMRQRHWSKSLNHVASFRVITFCVSRRPREMYCHGHARLCVCLSVCLCVCPWPHAHTIAGTRM